MDAISGAAWHP